MAQSLSATTAQRAIVRDAVHFEQAVESGGALVTSDLISVARAGVTVSGIASMISSGE